MSQHDKKLVQQAAKAARNSYADWWSKAYIRQQRKARLEQQRQERKRR